MHVSGLLRAPLPLDLNLFLQFVLTALILALGFLYLVKNTASKYFAVDDDANFDYNNNNPPSSESKMPGIILDNSCAVCSNSTTKLCSGCKLVRYCSTACQRYHWKSGHQKTCKKGRQRSTSVSLVPASGSLESLKDSKKVLFPYEEFVRLYYWERPGFPPCGLLNCGNSCFANVVLQCLACTRPLVAYLLEKGHQRECRRNDWCFMCEFQSHVGRATQTRQPFSPINILSRLPNIGGNLGYGKQEDAHEFMRFAIDTMQSACLDEFGGEKAVHPRASETTLIQHIFGGHLQSQVICARCGNVSNQFENMMDLTVEIQGDVSSLEECLDQFTVKERLHGDNMYKCDGCNDYVLAWKRLTIRQAPNILTIALKRFQSGRFGKLNKRVSFPETLDLSPYMSEAANSRDVYKLYGVIVHVDMLNASFFGHYICYTKDFSGNWYRIDDCKVSRVELDEVLSQGAYMLLYGRVFVRPSCLSNMEPLNKCEERKSEVAQETVPCAKQTVVEREEPSSSSQVLKEDIDMVDTDVEVCGSGCSVAEEGNISALEPPRRPHTLTITGAFSLERDPPMSTVEKKSWADANRPVKPASTDIDMDIDMVDHSNNGVCENGKALHDGSGSILSSDKVLLDDKADPFISNSDDVAGKDDLKVSGSTLTPFSSANLLEKRPKVSGSESMPAFPAGFLEKCPKVLGSESARVSLASGAGEHVPMDCTVSSTGPSNNGVCENGEAVHDGSDATPSGGEVLDNKTDPFISSTDDVAGKKDVIKVSGSKLTSLLPAGFIEQRPKVSGSKSKPRIPAGFLDKRPKKTHSKQEAKATTEIIGEMPLFPADSLEKGPKKKISEQRAKAPVAIGESKSACNLNGQSNGFTKSDSSHLNNGDIIGNVRKPHFPSDEDQMFTSQSSESNGKPEIVESGKALPSSCGTADDVARINVRRNNSGSKLKPTFTPGFLDTRTKKKTF